MNIPVFDLHCDTSLALLGETVNEPGNLKKNKLHIDLDRAKHLENYCQCFACFTTPMMEEWYHLTPTLVFEREIATIQREIDAHKRMIAFAYSARDVEANCQKGKMSAILTIEGPAGFGFDPALLEDLYAIGFRISTLGWNESNVLTGSHKTMEGLSDIGREYVREAQRLGMLVDVSHISDQGFWDIMEVTQAPVIASHSNSRTVCNHTRNLTDDMFKAIVQTGGVTGFNQCAPFVGDNPNLDTVCDHIIHLLELDPSGKHIALGGDLDGCDELPEGFEGIQSYPIMAQRLMERGLTENMVRDIFWNNAMNVLRAVTK